MIQPDKDSKNGVQSLEIGLSVAHVLVNSQGPMMLKDIAQQAGMSPAKAHRYLVSLIRAGLVEQDPASSRYDLGPFALNIGLVALDRLDRVRLGLTAIAHPVHSKAELAQADGQAIAKLGPGLGYQVDAELCTGCGACHDQCPCHAIELRQPEESQ